MAPWRHNPWGGGSCGLIQCQNSSPMLRHRNRHPSLSEPRKTLARDPLYFFNSLLTLRRLRLAQVNGPDREGDLDPLHIEALMEALDKLMLYKELIGEFSC